MMKTLTLNNEALYQGTTYRRGFVVVDEADEPIDISSCTARLTARIKQPDVVAVIEVDGILDEYVDQGVTYSRITFEIPPEATIGATWRTAGFDAELYWPDGEVSKLVTGLFRLVPEFTR